jgi:hypothetical protein
MSDFILTLLYIFCFGGLVFFPLAILVEYLIVKLRGPDFALWLQTNMDSPDAEKYTFKKHLHTFLVWPVLFGFWVLALARGRSMTEHLILTHQEMEERKVDLRKQRDEAGKQVEASLARLEEVRENQQQMTIRCRELGLEFETQTLWREYDKGDWVLYTRAMVFSDGTIEATHVVMETPQGWLVFRAMPNPTENIPVALMSKLKKARTSCDLDFEWIAVCHPGQQINRRHLWDLMTERLSCCGGPDGETND